MFASNSSQVSSDAVFIEDIFSTYLYTGNATARSITNGIDLAGKGGMVWFKDRSQAYGNRVFDTNRGTNKLITTNTTAAEFSSYTNMLTAFNADGFSIGNDSNAIGLNVNSDLMVSWTFRKQPKFFDVQTASVSTYPTLTTINHNLGSTPGCIMMKQTNASSDWVVWHTSAGNNNLVLNGTGSAGSSYAGYFVNINSTSFQVYAPGTAGSYVFYIFASNAGGFGTAGTDSVITCGTYTTDGSGNATVTLGYEPQWILSKMNLSGPNWVLADVMRGAPVSGQGRRLFANLSNTEDDADVFRPTATGFTVYDTPSQTFYYIAIRRGPMKTPTSGTSVYLGSANTASTGAKITTGFPVDLQIAAFRSITTGRFAIDRLRGASSTTTETGQVLRPNTTDAEFASTYARYWDNTGYQVSSAYADNSMIEWNFGRAPGYMDVVCYTGTGSTRTVAHNLGVAPELIIVKTRNNPDNDWAVYAAPLGATKHLRLNATIAEQTGSNRWGSTSPTASVFTVGDANETNWNTYNFVAYLFATCPGVSKVGSYTGSGTTKQIDCGFTGGARFVLIKRTDSTGDWYVWDTARGIVSGNDPYLLLNSTAAEVTNTDYIDAYSAGFEISSTAPAAINASGGTFIYLAIS